MIRSIVPRNALPVVLVLSLAACTQPDTLDRIQQEQVLHVVTHPASTVYYEENGEAAGFEYSLAKRFADYLGVELRVEVVDSLPKLFQRLDENHTHFAAAGLGLTRELRRDYRHGPVYARTRPIIVYNADAPSPETIEDLVGHSIIVRRGGPHEQILEDIQSKFPALEWQAIPDTEPTELLRRVNQGEVDIAIIGSNELEMNKVFFPEIREAFALDARQPIAWLFPESGDSSLMQEAREFFYRIRHNGGLAQLEERYYGHLDRLDYVGARTFTKHLENRLPTYRDTFIAAANAYDTDWRLLAAIGYQESHWRPNAVSPTGVRGLMMLTRNTAAYLGVENRVDPESSIWGGARYITQLQERVPDSITEPDRTWFALASYNVGLGHVLDARRLTEQAGKDPDKWMHVKEFLPRLAQRKHYRNTRHGYARGYEPVIYTQNIRRYYDVLKWMFPDEPESTEMASKQDSPLSDNPDPISSVDAENADSKQGTREPQAFRQAPPIL